MSMWHANQCLYFYQKLTYYGLIYNYIYPKTNTKIAKRISIDPRNKDMSIDLLRIRNTILLFMGDLRCSITNMWNTKKQETPLARGHGYGYNYDFRLYKIITERICYLMRMFHVVLIYQLRRTETILNYWNKKK